MHSFIGTLWKLDQEHLGSFEMWCWRRKEKTVCTDRVRNEEVITQGQGGEEYPTYNRKEIS